MELVVYLVSFPDADYWRKNVARYLPPTVGQTQVNSSKQFGSDTLGVAKFSLRLTRLR